MTCIIGWVTKDLDNEVKMYMGCDSQLTDGLDTKFMQEYSKISVYDNNMLIGFSGSVRVGNILKYRFKIPEQKDLDNEVYMHTVFLDSLIDCLTDNKALEKDKGVIVLPESNILIGFKNKLYWVNYDLQMSVLNHDYMAIGSGYRIALGGLYILNLYMPCRSPLELIFSLLRASSYIDSNIGPPFYVYKMDSKNVVKTFKENI